VIGVSSWQDVLDTFYGIVKDTEAAQTWLTTTQAEAWANQCLAELAEYTLPVDKAIVWAATAGEPQYALNTTGSGTLEVKLVEVNDEAIPRTTQRELWASSPTWQEHTGQPRFYYTDGLNGFDSEGLDIAFWPTPETTDSLRVTLAVVPDAVDNAAMTNPVMLPLWAVPGLLWGMLSVAYKAETRLQNLSTAQLFRTMFEDVMERLRMRSYDRVPVRVVFGGGGHGKGYADNDFRRLIPTAGVPYP
jgi:hypothetical protein